MIALGVDGKPMDGVMPSWSDSRIYYLPVPRGRYSEPQVGRNMSRKVIDTPRMD